MAADTHITVTFTADYDRIRPDPYPGIHLENTLEVTLSGVNEVRENNTRQAGNMSDKPKGMKILGQKSPDGGSQWKVAGENRLERVINGAEHHDSDDRGQRHVVVNLTSSSS